MEMIGEEAVETVTPLVKPLVEEIQNLRDSGYDDSGNVEKGSNIIIPFQPLNPILDNQEQKRLQSSAITESKPQPMNLSSIQGSANDFTSRGKT